MRTWRLQWVKFVGTTVALIFSLCLFSSCGSNSSDRLPATTEPHAPSTTATNAQETSDSLSAQPSSDSTSFGQGETLDDRLGASDGFAASIFFVSDLTGSLDVCGCAQNPQGGIARQKGFLNEFENRYRGIPYLYVDLGHSLSERTKFGTMNLLEPVRVGNEWVLRAYNELNVSAVNVSFRDLVHLRHTLAADVFAKQRRELPVLTRFVSANVKPKTNAHVALPPYLIQTLRGGRLKRPLKVALVGLTEVGTLPLEAFTIEDPLEVAHRVIPEVSAKADIVVVMGYLSRAVGQRLAGSGLPYNALLTAFRLPNLQPIRRYGKKLWATSIYEGRFLGELRIYTDPQGRFADLKARYIPLDQVVPDDPRFAALRSEARAAINKAGEQMSKEGTANATPATGATSHEPRATNED
ncbi:MAG: hypothetical protein RMM98_02495 [Acidobacteriota bacterium]|nr:hypothetical protein [Blastocatellia bacterium]MDW8238459.1 hypothetical protein [Acidobacteriota bacterium]